MRDTLLIVGKSVAKMRNVLARLRECHAIGAPGPVELVALLEARQATTASRTERAAEPARLPGVGHGWVG